MYIDCQEIKRRGSLHSMTEVSRVTPFRWLMPSIGNLSFGIDAWDLLRGKNHESNVRIIESALWFMHSDCGIKWTEKISVSEIVQRELNFSRKFPEPKIVSLDVEHLMQIEAFNIFSTLSNYKVKILLIGRGRGGGTWKEREILRWPRFRAHFNATVRPT